MNASSSPHPPKHPLATGGSQLVTYREVARALRCSVRHVENLVRHDPNFPVIRLGVRSVRFSLDEVLAHLKAQSRRRCEMANTSPPSDPPSSSTRRSDHDQPEELPF